MEYYQSIVPVADDPSHHDFRTVIRVFRLVRLSAWKHIVHFDTTAKIHARIFHLIRTLVCLFVDLPNNIIVDAGARAALYCPLWTVLMVRREKTTAK